MNSRRHSKFLAGLGTSLILLSMLVNSAMAAAGDTTRVSVASDGTQGNGNSLNSSISADGRYVAFASSASNLVSGDTNGTSDGFVYDRQSGQTERISVASNGTQEDGETWSFISISADGRYVAFFSDASNRVSGDTNGTEDVFVHDRQTGQTERISVASDGTQGNGFSYYPSISYDGRYVTFFSDASNLVSGDTNGVWDVFVHDRQTGQTERVSVASDGMQGNYGSWSLSSISADGRYVAFESEASNLVSEDTNGDFDVFVHDRQTEQPERVSVASDGTQGNSSAIGPFISADGRYVAFSSNASNLVSGDTNGTDDAFVHDRQSGQTTRVSVASDGTQGNDHSNSQSISADGRYVAFASNASNLVSRDTNGVYDVFVHENDISTWILSGNVRDASANPLSDVLITVTTSTGMTVATTMSIADGTYEVPNLLSGTYLIYASKADYLFNPYPLTVILDSDQTGQNILGSLSSCNLTNGIDGVNALGNMCRIPTAQPFLDLPFEYSDFTTTANGFEPGNPSGKVWAWVDHDLRQSLVRTWGQNTSSGGELIHWDDCEPRSSCYNQHEGTDFALPPGTPVKPAAPGVVAEVCKNTPCRLSTGYGRYVLIDHENGYATLYAHLQSINVIVGDRFYSNTGFAPLGTSGGSGGYPLSDTYWKPHLHFGLFFDLDNSETWTMGEEVDPYGWKPPNNTPDPMGRPNINMWKYPLNVSYCYNPSTVTQTAQFDNLTASFPTGSLTSDTTVTLGIGSLPGNLLEALRSASQSFFLSLVQWLQTGANQFAIQQASAGFPTPASITIEYDPAAILHLVESQLTINRWDDLSSSWIALPTTLDTIAHTATAQTDATGSFILQAPLICPVDTLEVNDNYATARVVQTDGTLVSNLFDIAIDEDWFMFDALAGTEYAVQTTNLAASVDTALEIYDADGVTLLASNDNSGGGNASSLTWQAPQDGVYFARIVQASGSSFGCGSTYNFAVLTTYHIYLPLVIR